MSTPNAPGPVQGTEPVTVVAPVTDDTANALPYAEYLERVPEGMRPLVEPVFKEWDANVTKRFQDVHSKSAEYDPYKSVFEKYEPEALEQAALIAERLETDPEGFYRALQDAFQFDANPGPQQAVEQGVEGQQAGDEVTEDPRLTQLQQQVEAQQSYLAQQQQEREEAAAMAELEGTMASLHTEHGAFDDRFVLALMANGIDPQQAVTAFKTTVQQYATQANAPAAEAPVVVGGSSAGYASPSVDPATLNSTDTKSLVAQMLAAANKQ